MYLKRRLTFDPTLPKLASVCAKGMIGSMTSTTTRKRRFRGTYHSLGATRCRLLLVLFTRVMGAIVLRGDDRRRAYLFFVIGHARIVVVSARDKTFRQ